MNIYIVGTHYKCLMEALLMSIHNTVELLTNNMQWDQHFLSDMTGRWITSFVKFLTDLSPFSGHKVINLV